MNSPFNVLKGKKGASGAVLGAAAILVLAFVIASVSYVMPSIAIGATVWTDKLDYAPSDVVYVSGSGFIPGLAIQIKITRPDGIVDTCPYDGSGGGGTCGILPVADSFGSFSNYVYDIDGIYGLYVLEASDGTNTAHVEFTDASAFAISIIYPPDLGSVPSPVRVYGTWNVTNNPPGLLKHYNVQIDWGDGNVDDEVNINRIDNGLSGSNQIYSGTFDTQPIAGCTGGDDNCTLGTFDHTYSLSPGNCGPFMITVKLYHAEPPGNEEGDSAATASITVQEVCDNGIDDDCDNLTDCDDPDCSLYPDCIDCSTYGNSIDCESNQRCEWCPQCSGSQFSGGADRCVDAGDCNYFCEFDPTPFCGATCESNSDCDSYCDSLVWYNTGICDTGSTCSCSFSQSDCDDGDVCTSDSCDDQAGCSNDPIANCCYSAADCDDQNACTTDTCDDNQCAHTAITCDDGVGCTDDTCDTSTGCVYTPNDGHCLADTDCADYYCDQTLDCQVEYELGTTICRSSGGDCDPAEYCTGSSALCPVDSKSTSLCRQSAGDCDVDEYCDGVNNDCPIDSFLSAATECRPSAGDCDIAEFCTGDSASCPADSVRDNGYVCESDLGVCEADDTCDGVNTYCNENYAQSGTDCGICAACDGSGTCAYDATQDSDCSDTSCPDSCNINPDNNPFTWDYADDVPNTCSSIYTCTSNTCDYSHACADADNTDGVFNDDGVQTCTAECDGAGIECQDKCVGSVLYSGGSCGLNDCLCDYSNYDCNIDDGCYVYQDTGCEDRDYSCDPAGCDYTSSNQYNDYKDDFVDYCSADTMRTHRTLHDYYCNGACSDHTSWVDDSLVEDCNLQDGWYNTTTKQWVSTGECTEKEQIYQDYRDYTCSNADCTFSVTDNRWFDTGNTRNKQDGTTCDDGLYCTVSDTCTSGVCGGPDRDCSSLDGQCQVGMCNEDANSCEPDYTNYPFSTPCEADQDLCTKDHCDGAGSCVLKEEIPEPQDPIKTIGEPKLECNETDWCEWKITMVTPITVDCGEANVKWRYALDGEWKKWHEDESPAVIHFPEESNHTLEIYCENECGEKSANDTEKFKVEGTAFEIPLYKKWNLISVPFTLLDDDPETVFSKIFFQDEQVENIGDYIDSVWTYDPEHDICDQDWCIWSPGESPDDLKIVPGWGYWVLVKDKPEEECHGFFKCFWKKNNEEPLWLIIGGSLFSPATTPPARNLVKGWNLIGYYGVNWEEYDEGDLNFMCGDEYGIWWTKYDRKLYGSESYCALNSLIDTQEGYPRWSSLWSFVNCGNHNTDWLGLSACINSINAQGRMYAGRGYWIELDVPETYAPTTKCTWNDDFQCVWTNGKI